jgi:hypothetical protein
MASINYVSDTAKLEQALICSSQRALQLEAQIRDLESRLSTSLSDSRALSALLVSSATHLATSTRRSERALTQHVPYTTASLAKVGEIVQALNEDLPVVREQTEQIRACYDGGRYKARELISSLEFLNMSFFSRAATIVIGPSPVSVRKTMIFRTLTGILLLFLIWGAWATVASTVRTHRSNESILPLV